jgi:hypothetical protein
VKNILLIVGVLVILVGGSVWYGDHHAKLKAERDLGAAQFQIAQDKLQKAKDDKAYAALDKDSKEKQKTIDQNTKDIAGLKASNAAILADNTSYKNKIKETTDDQLAVMTNSFLVDGHVALLGIGKFSFTRPDTEQTVGIFRDNQDKAKTIVNKDAEIAKVNDSLTQKDGQIADIKKQGELKDAALVRCGNEKTTLAQQYNDAKKVSFWSSVKSFGEGTVFGIVLTVVGRLLKAI